MKLLKRTKLNTKGFSHLETLLAIAVVAVVGVSGYFVYQHHNKKTTTTAHAGGWTFIGTQNWNGMDSLPNVSVGACKTPTNNPTYGPHYLVKDQVILSHPEPTNGWSTEVTMYDNNNNPTVTTSNSSWWSGTLQQNSFYVSQLKTNYIRFTVDAGTYGRGGGGPLGSNYLSAGSLASC